MKSLQITLLALMNISLIQPVLSDTVGSSASFSSKFYIQAGLGAVFSNTNTSSTSDSNSILFSPTIPGTSLFTLPNVTWQNKFGNGYDISLLVGQYLSPCLHGDLEFLFQNLQRESLGHYDWLEQNAVTGAVFARQVNNPISKISTRASLYSFFTNATYDFVNQRRWTPFLGGGIGITWLRSENVQTNNTLSINDPSVPLTQTSPALQNSPYLYGTAFAWQLKAGIQYPISELAQVIVQYRLVDTTAFKASGSSIITNSGTTAEAKFIIGQQDVRSLLTHAVELNLKFDC